MSDTDYDLEEVLEAKRLDGSLIRDKSRALIEVGLDKVYPRLVDPDIPTSALMEIMKYLAEIGDMKPKKEAVQAATGPGFSITINIPQAGGAPPITIEGTATPVSTEFDDEDDEDEEEPTLALTGEPPEVNFNTLDFQFNTDLMLPNGVDVEGDDE